MNYRRTMAEKSSTSSVKFHYVLNATLELLVNEKTSGGFKFNELFRPKTIFKCFAFKLTAVV